ncbi:hypothetical protein F5Y00DRAFT_274245 [Daldinia vernicosa]|uniref:uncharacterized protein n=1 Tax=Daldinia vernicosa TaxID=114800 RepID=UPI00200802B8|nr:uncharacterized protein F5Y00DRAFT_274245 [Daldinia vernicosa]KAI0851991.1 hypothetical protein F5Y00DRAFT_274245 [Daldinia vernicosa]
MSSDPSSEPSIEPAAEPTAESLTIRLERIETAGLYGFTDFGTAGFHEAAPYFISLYTSLIQLLGEIARVKVKDGADAERELFGRGVKFLDTCHDFVRDNIEELMKFKNFHYKLWARLENFSQQPFTSSNKNISRHITQMTLLAGNNAPPASQSWVGDALPEHKRFVRAYNEFMGLEDWQLRTDADRRELIFFSQEILDQALLGLRMPMVSIQIHKELFREGGRPTYIDFPSDAEEWLYGLGQRPGVLDLKLKLGGKLTPEEEEKKKQAQQEPKKRPQPSSESNQPGLKKTRLLENYTITMDNVDADIEDIYSDAAFMDVFERPGYERLLNPTVENREDTLNSYAPEFSKRLRICRRNYYRPEAPPSSQDRRDQILKQMENDIPRLRDEIHEKAEIITSPSKLKEARVAAYTLKFIRALYMKLVLSATPEMSSDKMNRALRDRLDDWILHEQAWNAGDDRAINNPRTAAARKSWLMRFVDARNENIEKWWVLRDQLDAQINSQAKRDAEADNSEAQGEKEKEKEAPEKAGDKTEPANKPEEAEKKAAKRTPVYWVEPRKPSKTVFFDERFERRREDRARAAAKTRLIGPPAPGQYYSNEEQYRLEDEHSAQLAINFPSQGGPPKFQDMPKNTIYDKIIYMLVMTHWRFYQGLSVI